MTDQVHFEVGQKVEITHGSWHLKEYPHPAVIAEVMTPGFTYRCQVEGFEWLLGPFCYNQLRAAEEAKPRVRKRRNRGFFSK